MALDSDWESASCQDYDMLLSKTEESTDARWIKYGTLYGVRYNSFIQLVGGDPYEFLSRNMDWIYFQMFLLGIMQRSVLQRFYREASGTSISRRRNKASRLSASLQEKYILFLNRMWFSEVTEQEQGDDLFSSLQENMELEYDKALLDSVLNELASQHSKTINDAINYLLLPLSILTIVMDGLALFISFEDVDKIFTIIPEMYHHYVKLLFMNARHIFIGFHILCFVLVVYFVIRYCFFISRKK